jgi:hypothetical protein
MQYHTEYSDGDNDDLPFFIPTFVKNGAKGEILILRCEALKDLIMTSRAARI